MPYNFVPDSFHTGVTAEALRAKIERKSAISFQRGLVNPKFHVEGVNPHQPFFFSEKWDKCSFVWYINLDRSFYRFVAIHACDGQTDGQTDGLQTEFSSLYRVCITCSAVKINGAHYRDVLLGQHLLLAIRSVTGDFFT